MKTSDEYVPTGRSIILSAEAGEPFKGASELKEIVPPILKKQKLLCILLFAGAIVSVVAGCKDDTVDTGMIDIVFPDSNISYGRSVQPLFDRGCALSGCHVGSDAPDGLQLDNYQNAVGSDPGVIRFNRDTTNSRILWRIEGTHSLPRMPPSPRSPLTSNQIKGIRTWIFEGAQNN